MNYLEEIDISSAKERFMGNEAMYKKFLYQFPEKNMMAELEKLIADGGVEDAFRSAHTMKGVVGNLSLVKLLESVGSVVEVLRAGSLPDEGVFFELQTAYQRVLGVIDEIKAGDISLF